MKKTLLFAGMLLALSASVAAASGLNMSWGLFCPTNISATSNVNDPCDGSSQANGASYTLVGSVRPAAPAPTLCLAEDFFVDLQEATPQLSDYWHLEDENQPGQLNAGGCRGASTVTGNIGSLIVSINNLQFPTTFTGCTKFWGTAPTGGINYGVMIPDAYPGISAPNRARLIGHFAKSPGSAMTAGVQYGAFVALIDTNHQISDPLNPPAYVCQGCQDAVCLVFNEIILYQPPGTPNGNIDITSEDSRRWVTWQGPVAGSICPGPTPTHKATWGQVKSLYR